MTYIELIFTELRYYPAVIRFNLAVSSALIVLDLLVFWVGNS